MSSKNKIDKKSKAIFTVNTDRLCEDSSEECYGKDINKDDRINLEGFQFPLDYEIEQIHQLPQTTELSAYIKHLQNQVKTISNKIQFEYHHARQTVLFIGQSTNLSKFVSRKKIDQEFQKMGIIRKYDPKSREKGRAEMQDDDFGNDVGDITLAQIKKKIQIEWESQISEQMEKERKRLRQIQKKRQKQIEQIDKDFEKIMKKRKLQKEAQALLKNQQIIKQMQNGDSSSNRTPKKIQKRQKIERRASQRNRQKNGMQEQEPLGSQIESCSAMNQGEEISLNENGQGLQFQQNLKMNLLQASNSNEWNHQIIEKPEHVMDSNELNNDHEGLNEL